MPGCTITIVCPTSRGWIVGDTASEKTHLVITASPHPLHSYGRFIDWPARKPGPLRPLTWVTVNGRRMRAVFVPSTNESIYMHHVVLIWTVGGHTYGMGFHDPEQFVCPSCAETPRGLHRTLLLDEELARSVELVQP